MYNISIDIATCGTGIVDHILQFDTCRDLPNWECPSTQTSGPTNGCDEYRKGNDYYWVGGLTNVTITRYNNGTYTIYYPGISQQLPNPHTRSLKIDYICDQDVELQVECYDVHVWQYFTDYDLRIRSKAACPLPTPPIPTPTSDDKDDKNKKLGAGSIVGIIFGGFFASTCGIGILVLGIVCIGFWVLMALACVVVVIVGLFVVFFLICGACCCGGSCGAFLFGRMSKKGYTELDGSGTELEKISEI